MKPPSGNCSKIVNTFTDRDAHQETIRWQSNFRLKDQSNVIDFSVSKKRIEVEPPKAHRSVVNHWLPTCISIFAKSMSNSLPLVTGYFLEKKWNSLVCRSNVTDYNFHHVEACLQNKIVYFIGDSTTNHVFRLLVEELSLKVVKPKGIVTWAHPGVAFDKNNITLYFRGHGHPSQNPGPPYTRTFVSDTISTMVGGYNVFVVFNIGVHFYEINPKTFMHKLKYIRKAINEHHQRFPNSKFIIKGMNVVEPGNSKDWPLFRYHVLLKDYFKNMNNVLFVNVRDLTTVWPLYKDVHARDEALQTECLLLLSYICE